MIRPPYSARVAAGLLVTAVEETKKLPTYAVTLPMTAVSQVLQAGMRLQQNVAEMAIKGDAVLDGLFNKEEEQPAWARFDEDEEPSALNGESPTVAAAPTPSGRFALYSSTPDDIVSGTTTATKTAPDAVDAPAADAAGTESVGIVESLDYDSLTLAQLRAKLRSLDLGDLRTLADHETANRARTPFVTMLENRIATKSEK